MADTEQLKIKLGAPESLFAKCEAMLWDMTTSKRLDARIHEELAAERKKGIVL